MFRRTRYQQGSVSAKSGGRGLMLGSIDGMRLVPTERTSIAKSLSETL